MTIHFSVAYLSKWIQNWHSCLEVHWVGREGEAGEGGGEAHGGEGRLHTLWQVRRKFDVMRFGSWGRNRVG